MDETYQALVDASSSSLLICKAITAAIARQPGIDVQKFQDDLLQGLSSLDEQSKSMVVQTIVVAFANSVPDLMPKKSD